MFHYLRKKKPITVNFGNGFGLFWDTSEESYIADLQASSNHLYVLHTYAARQPLLQDTVLHKFTKSGDLLWSKQIPGSNVSRVLPTSDDSSVYVATYDTVLRLDADGVTTWSRTVSSPNGAIRIDTDGSNVYVGFTKSGTTNQMAALALNSAGQVLWNHTTGSSDQHEYVSSIAHFNNETYLIGEVYVSGSAWGGFAKINSAGTSSILRYSTAIRHNYGVYVHPSKGIYMNFARVSSGAVLGNFNGSSLVGITDGTALAVSARTCVIEDSWYAYSNGAVHRLTHGTNACTASLSAPANARSFTTDGSYLYTAVSYLDGNLRRVGVLALPPDLNVTANILGLSVVPASPRAFSGSNAGFSARTPVVSTAVHSVSSGNIQTETVTANHPIAYESFGVTRATSGELVSQNGQSYDRALYAAEDAVFKLDKLTNRYIGFYRFGAVSNTFALLTGLPVESFTAFKALPDGNLLIALDTYSGSYYSAVMKVTTSGEVLWARRVTIAGSRCSATCDSDGNVYLSTSHGAIADLSVIKFNTSGALVWKKQYRSSNTLTPIQSEMMGGSLFILVSHGTQALTLKLNTTTGIVQATRQCPSYPRGMACDHSTGTIYESVSGWLLKLNGTLNSYTIYAMPPPVEELHHLAIDAGVLFCLGKNIVRVSLPDLTYKNSVTSATHLTGTLNPVSQELVLNTSHYTDLLKVPVEDLTSDKFKGTTGTLTPSIASWPAPSLTSVTSNVTYENVSVSSTPFTKTSYKSTYSIGYTLIQQPLSS